MSGSSLYKECVAPSGYHSGACVSTQTANGRQEFINHFSPTVTNAVYFKQMTLSANLQLLSQFAPSENVS
jgi:hypothetical protein